MIKELVKLSNHLDAKGLRREADHLDGIIRKIARRSDHDGAIDVSEDRAEQARTDEAMAKALKSSHDFANQILGLVNSESFNKIINACYDNPDSPLGYTCDITSFTGTEFYRDSINNPLTEWAAELRTIAVTAENAAHAADIAIAESAWHGPRPESLFGEPRTLEESQSYGEPSSEEATPTVGGFEDLTLEGDELAIPPE